MTGLDGQRVYLDWNATAPLRPEARAAMLAAMEAVGNPSSVHAEGRAARAIVETARRQVAALMDCAPPDVVFLSGATEAANAVLNGDWDVIARTTVEHDCIEVPAARHRSARRIELGVDRAGRVTGLDALPRLEGKAGLLCVQAANSETGVEQPLDEIVPAAQERGWRVLVDRVQACGRRVAAASARGDFELVAGHKLGGPKGVGALVLRCGAVAGAANMGGGQELGRRSGTENVIGIAGFGAAAEAAREEREGAVWARIEKLRNILENRLEAAAPDLIIMGRDATRLPNTSCIGIPGWRGETQVMALDLAGFAVSAGSACSSGKVASASRVLRAMGADEDVASSAIRVSMGAATTEAEVTAFAEAWERLYARRCARAA